ncbi:MAG: SiaB family protein kinase [Salinivirgaceae bacterium]|nr:SiaB family protein kinase [Salinivirgaceae bacterium]
MPAEVEKWYKNVTKDDVIYLFKGEVTDQLIAQSLDIIERQLESTPLPIRKKIYNVLVECLQNLYHHSAACPIEKEREFCGRVGVCLLSEHEGHYHVVTGNFVEPRQKEFLTKHLDKINSLDRDGQKEMYKEILDNQTFSEKGGGGLGMVDIARKSGSRLNYNFINCGSDYNFFTLDVTFN